MQMLPVNHVSENDEVPLLRWLCKTYVMNFLNWFFYNKNWELTWHVNPAPENFEMPTSGQMILINSGTNELEKESKK